MAVEGGGEQQKSKFAKDVIVPLAAQSSPTGYEEDIMSSFKESYVHLAGGRPVSSSRKGPDDQSTRTFCRRLL